MLELFVIRHGETTANLAGRWQGHGDSPLTEKGRAQAAALGARFAGQRFDAVYSSDLVRARHTADQLEGPRHVDPRFRELSVGRWEGCTRDEVLAQWPGDFDHIMDDPSVPIGGGESWDQVAERARAGLARLREAHPSGRVALVAHGGFNLSMLELVMGVAWRWPRPFGRIRNTAVAEVHLDAAGGRLVRYNDIDHLAEAEPVPIKISGRYQIDAVTEAGVAAAALDIPAERFAALPAGRTAQVLRHARGDQVLCWNVG